MKRRKSIFAPEEEISLDQLMPSFRDDSDGRKLEIADWSDLPDAQAMNAELRELIRQAIRELPEILKQTVLLRDVEGLSTEEAAEVLQVSTDVIKTRLHRGRLALRQKIDRRLLEATVKS